VGRYDSVLAQSPDGVGGRWLRRDRRVAVSLLREAWRLNRAVRRQRPALQERYRASVPQLTSAESWRNTTSR
jgi:galactofuranosylgalactofuranosylrhamnosyl-N-acetylglucosaminyl-diphospho-decaprenol beta-1,5/1,6-galactofuranosyltransferase